jgi:hypothetical protein
MEYAAEGVRVDALVAGAFDTPMLKKAIEQAAGGDAERHRAMEQQFLSLVPLRRITLVCLQEVTHHAAGFSHLADLSFLPRKNRLTSFATTGPTQSRQVK